MGIFGAIKEIKARYDRSVEEKRRLEEEKKERERQRKEAEKKAAEERERSTIEKLASGELMKAIVSVCGATPWIGDSQGSWDSNRRQLIVTPVAVVINNYDTDVFFNCLEDVKNAGGDKVEYTLHRELEPVMDPGGNWIRMPTSETIKNDYALEKYDNNEAFHLSAILFESFGYGAITNEETLKFFAMALQREISACYKHPKISHIVKGKYGFWKIQISVEAKEQKSVL